MTSRNPSPQLVDGVDVDAVAAAVRRCPGVEDLAVGALGSAASYLPGRTVPGIAVTADRVTIQVRARWAVTTAERRDPGPCRGARPDRSAAAGHRDRRHRRPRRL